ncbi:MAG: hypothetical protein EOM20_06380 [Spartobacteria bacterium]|nr:hypothetical protein [Spartobacteria bacterium]
MYKKRNAQYSVIQALRQMPAVCLLGPRQCGKSTLVRTLVSHQPTPYVYLDLERPSDLAKMTDPEQFLSLHRKKPENVSAG